MRAQLREDIYAENNAFAHHAKNENGSTGVRLPPLPKRHPFLENRATSGPAGRLTGEIVDLLSRTNNYYCMSTSWFQDDKFAEFVTDIHKDLMAYHTDTPSTTGHPDLTTEKLLLQSMKKSIRALADDMFAVSYGRALRVQWNEPVNLRKMDKWGRSLQAAATFYAVAYHLSVFKLHVDFEAIRFATTAVDNALYADKLISYNPLTHTHSKVNILLYMLSCDSKDVLYMYVCMHVCMYVYV